MPNLWIILFDLVAILVLIFGIYFRRYRRRDMLLAYVGLNLGIMGVTMVFTSSSVGAGLGLGLFGVLSIIRLRSSELAQEEVAYYFASLALGLVAGLQPEPLWVTPVFSSVFILVIGVIDSDLLHARYRRQVITLDSVYPNEVELKYRLEQMLGGSVRRVIVQAIDLVRDQQVVDVRYVVPKQAELERLDAARRASERRIEAERLEALRLTELSSQEEPTFPDDSLPAIGPLSLPVRPAEAAAVADIEAYTEATAPRETHVAVATASSATPVREHAPTTTPTSVQQAPTPPPPAFPAPPATAAEPLMSAGTPEPTATESLHTESAPVESAPVESAPVEPVPVEPTPTEPAPAQPPTGEHAPQPSSAAAPIYDAAAAAQAHALAQAEYEIALAAYNRAAAAQQLIAQSHPVTQGNPE
ncbi:hypothetical protein GCM10022198_02550 [Klugiella xanthotipulae]|uniref:Uncharacterized protein DUF4956 n=1 Tax=Klugiella xanthotipulae TaxID=244735 RepID=A0A543I560_9MICO|nr:DUF4956 domain-containing protein [Klugiella xanthotipulae]TQM65610.1 uncharacterized protein DUF4956 [Klugiella xanthotipulae]